jgi:hypothetical protein
MRSAEKDEAYDSYLEPGPMQRVLFTASKSGARRGTGLDDSFAASLDEKGAQKMFPSARRRHPFCDTLWPG